MNPAYSVIVFTTASGAGYGLLVALAAATLAQLVPLDPALGATCVLVGLALVTVGLMSSTLHLGRPERAWRALSQWRSSWLSREGVAAIVTYLPAVAAGALWTFLPDASIWLALSLLLIIPCALVTVWCTGMIYAALPTIRAWYQPLTAPTYLALSLLTGTTLLGLILASFGVWSVAMAWAGLVLAVVSWVVKASYWEAVDADTPVRTLADATGLHGLGQVRPLVPPHTQANFVMREMGYAIARKHASRVRALTVILLFVIPIVASLVEIGLSRMGGVILPMTALAVLAAGLGVLAERWLFFAEARHISMVYYDGRPA